VIVNLPRKYALTTKRHKSILGVLFPFPAQFFKQSTLPPSGVKDEKGLPKDDPLKPPKDFDFPLGAPLVSTWLNQAFHFDRLT
jgi:hypothetical protein